MSRRLGKQKTPVGARLRRWTLKPPLVLGGRGDKKVEGHARNRRWDGDGAAASGKKTTLLKRTFIPRGTDSGGAAWAHDRAQGSRWVIFDGEGCDLDFFYELAPGTSKPGGLGDSGILESDQSRAPGAFVPVPSFPHD